MDVRTPLFQNIACVLIGILFLNPIVSTAAQLTVDAQAGGNTSLAQAGNGVPVVNIATPNGSGLSHNKFSEYNVGQQGLTLNNATDKLQATQLGGIIVGNPNFNGQAAGLILNEVTGANTSQLKGYTEVAGKSAAVIVVNPHGITCDGCGFINTPRVTLTTGKPIVENGRLDRFDVNGGQISIQGAGLNASNIEQFDLITRSAKINAELHANKLNVIIGRNQVKADDLTATAKAADGSSQPQLAIDSSALGGMYAGAIRLVGTEAGVGVKLAGDMAVSAGDIQIDANGQLSLAQTAASQNLKIQAQSVELTDKTYAAGNIDISSNSELANRKSLATAGSITLQGGQLINQGVIEAGVNPDNSRNALGDVRLSGEGLQNSGTVVANRDLEVQASQLLNNQTGTLNGKGHTQIDAGQLDNRAGRILAGSTLNLAADAIDNRQAGLIHSHGAADVQVAGALHNQQGQLVSEAKLGVQAQQLNNQGGWVIARDALQLHAQDIDNSAVGVISAQASVQIAAQSLSNAQGGEVSAGAELGLDVKQLDNSDSGSISSVEALTLQADTIDNRDQGTISSEQVLTLNAASLDSSAGGRVESRGDLQATLGNLKQQGGVLLSEGRLIVNAGAIDNSQSGLIHGRQGLQLQAGQVDNSDKGRISSQGAFTASLSGLDQQGGGQFVSSGSLTLDLAGGHLNNSRQGLLSTPGSLLLKNVATIDNSQGSEISSDRAFTLVSGELNNSAGKILSGEALELRITRALRNNLGGLLSAAKQLSLSAGILNNSGAGQISSLGDMQLSLAGALNNSQQGLIGSQAALRIDAADIDNHDQGELSSAGALQLKGSSLNNQGGLVIGDASLDLETSGLLDNSQQGVLAAGAAFSLKAGQLLNRDKGLIQGDAGMQATIQGAFDNSAGSLRTGSDLLLVSDSLDNSSGNLSSGGTLTLTSGALNNAKGTLAGAWDSHVTSSGLNNDAGTLSSQGDLYLVSGAASSRDGGVIVTAGQLQLQADSLDASNSGRVVANGAADVQLDGQLDLSVGGQLLSGAALLLRAQTIDNSKQGLISGKGAASVEATSIDNRQGGEISSNLGLTLVTDELDNREQGRVIAEAGLRLVADHVFNSAMGVLSAAQALNLQTRVLGNSGGRVLSGALLSLSAEHIDNSAQGRISAGGDLLLVTQQLDNQQQGEVLSAGALELHAKNIDSRDQGLIAGEGAMAIRVTEALDLSQGGQIIGEAVLDLQASSLSTRQQGLVAANGALQVTATSIDNAEGGEISSQNSLTLAADSLDNSDGGRIIGETGVNASLEQLDNSGKGLLASNAGLVLQAKQIDNSAGGTLSGVQLLTLNAETLNNQGAGRVLSGGDLQLTLDKLNNSDAGLLSSRGDLLLQGTELDNSGGNIVVDGQGKVVADRLDSSDGGQLSSLGDLEVEAKILKQQGGGELLSNGQLDLRVDTLDNSNGGLVSGLQGLSISADSLTNQGGELSTDANLSIQATRLDNSAAGKVIAGNVLSLTVAQLLNQAKGVLSGQHSLTLSGASLDNSGAGLLVSQGAIDLTLAATLNNSDGGSLLAQGPLKLRAASLDNSQDGLLSSKAGMDLELTGDLNNQAGTLIADGALQLSAQQLDNSLRGVLNSKGDLKVELDELVQQGGELLSQGKLTLNAGDIDNSQAGLIAATQGIAIVTGNLDNSAGGEISSSAAVHIDAADLDNSDAGLVIGDGGLWLTVQRLFNQSLGLLSGRDGLVLQTDSLDNSQGGTLTSQQQLDVQLSGALDNHAQGALLSEGGLQLQAGELNNSSGVLSSVGELAIATGTLNNQGGKLVTDDQLKLTSTSLDNSQSGRISAKQALSISTGQLDNQHQGLISGAAAVSLTTAQLNNHNQGLIATPGALLLNNLDTLNNSAGGEISSSQSFLLKASQLNNSAGRVISGQELQLQITQALLNNLNGVLSAAKLTVAAASLDNSAAGVLASRGDIQVNLTGKLDNHDQGTLSAAQELSIASASLDNSNDGLLASGGALQLHTGAANNQGGSILSQAALDASTAALDNRGGVLSSHQALTLSAGAIDNRDNGLITSAGKLTLNAASLDSSRHLADSGGEVSAKQDLQLTVSQLIQQQGRLIGEAGVRVDFKGGDLDNRGGLLSATGPLTLLNLGKQDNRDAGEVSSNQSYSIAASAIDNGEQGRLISAGSLSLDVGSSTLRNTAGGLISGWQGLTVDAGNLDNNALGTLSSRDGDLDVELSGVLNNSGEGALVSKGKLAVDAGSLNNSGKGILSSEGDLELSLSGALNNSASGLIDSQGTLMATAGAVNNQTGQIGSLKAASLTATSLDNSAGQLSSNAALNLTLSGNLINTQQAKLAGAGPLVLKAAAIDNQGGSLVSQNLLSLIGSSLNNANGGTLAARNGLNLLLTGALNNSADGLIHSELGALDIRAQSLNNQGGTLSSQQNLTLNLDGKLDNQGGHIQSQAGNLDLQKTSAVDNSAGVLSSVTGWLKLATTGLFDNDTGTTQAQSLVIDGKGVDNRGGHISALSGDTAIDIGTATFNNQGGGLYAHQLLDVIAGSFNNEGAAPGQGGKVTAGQIDFSLSGALNNSYGILESASTLNLTAASIDNQLGSLRALGTSGDTGIAATSLDNRNGTIETANTNLDLNVASLQSSGGSILHVGTGDFGLSAAQVTGAGGDLSTNGLLTLTADSWTNSGVLQAGQLVLNIGNFTQTSSGQLLAGSSFNGSGSNWVNHGLLASDGNFSLNLSGAYSGNGQATSLGDLNLSAGSISLASSTRIAGSGLTNVSATGLLSNLGKLTSAGDLTVTANTLNNYGTLGSAENLRLVTPTLLNENGLIFSGDDMTLRVNSFTNKFADVYSLGALSVAKDDAGSQLSVLENRSSSIESVGDMSLRAATFTNRKELFTTSKEQTYGHIHLVCYDCSGDHHNVDYVATERFETELEEDSAAAQIYSGGNLDIRGGTIVNRYSSLSAAGDIAISATTLENTGAALGLIERVRRFNTGRITDGTDERFRANHINPYNALPLPKETPDELYRWNLVSDIETQSNTGIAASAIIQAGGNISIQAAQTLENSVVRESHLQGGGANRVADSATQGTGITLVVQLNAQLPPDLQQQQVNPLSLPGFSLPQGESGLFRLSGQQAQSTTVNHAQSTIVDRTLAGSNVTLGQQEQSLAAVDAQGRSFAVVTQGGQSVEQVAGSGLHLSSSTASLQASGSAVTVDAGSNPAATAFNGQSLPATAILPGTVEQIQRSEQTLNPGAIGGNPLILAGNQAQAAGAPSAQTSAIDAPVVQPLAQGQSANVSPLPSHKYLIETNPELTNLKQFLGSDYLLGNLGYTPDNTQKRLGDGLYEQRLIREAVVARTGQRFLAGLSSDEAMFRHLMDNAIASKQALNLSLGVTLTAEQVAALTHDIVWLEEYEVNGEKVLVPVLYLAQAKGRLAPSGALIQGQDVALISGGDLSSAGTLRASDSLSVSATNIGNSGLMQASERLSLLATDSIRNAQGGIINGRDVSLTALTGDIINERSVTQESRSGKNFSQLTSVVDNAARIEASNDLSIIAGRDLLNIGGALEAGGDAELSAGRDVVIASAQAENGLMRKDKRHFWSTSSSTQYASDVQVGGNLSVEAGQDLTVIASKVKAGGDIALVAGGVAVIAAAATENSSEYRYKSSKKKINKEDSSVRQQAAVVEADGDVDIFAGQDLTLVASQVKAGNNVALDAEQDINILSAKDESASFYFKKKKGSFGRSSSKQQEKYDSTNIASGVEAGNDLTLNASKTAGGMSIDGGRDVTVIGSQLKAGNDLLVGATGDVAVLSGVEVHGSYSKKTKSGFLGLSKSGKSQLKTKASQVASELEAGNDVVIAAGNHIRLRASETTAGNDVELRAGLVTDTGDINLVSANDTAYSRSERYSKKVGVSLSGGMLSIGSAKKAGEEARNSTSVGSQVAAERDAILQAERDINVIGSSVSAGRNLLIDAGRDINVLAAESKSASATSERNRHSGVDLNSDSNGFTAFVGNDVQVEKILVTRNTAAASQLQAGIDLDLQASRDINQTGSDLQAGRDINLGAIRNIILGAAAERVTNEQEEAGHRNGLTANMSHNFANTVDAIKGIGQGENIVSQVSSVLKAADSVTQFVSGPTTANHIGTTSQRTGTIEGVVSHRPSTLVAGSDVNIQAGNDIEVRGTHIQTQRDINMAARDITLDVARGEKINVSEQTLSQNGINGGSTFNSSRVGIGGSHGTITEDGQRGTSFPSQLEAGRDVKLHADRDLGLIGTQVLVQRDIDLKAGNDLNIRAAQNDADYDMRRKSGGGEVGLALGGQDFISVYASVDIGKGKLDREGARQQEAYLYAGKGLNFESGRDTTIAGARMEGEEVTGKVGRDLLVSSITDTGKVSGKEFDASMTVSVGLYGSFSVSGSVGVGKTNGSTDWVQGQAAITARDRLDIRSENHTQLDGAVLASNTGTLKLDTNTLGFRDIEGHDREHAWYINAGGSYSSGGDSGPNAAATAAVVDTSQENKDGSNSWNLSGYDNRTEREQILRATVGLGEVVVRGDTDTGRDSTVGLNRDVSRAIEITKDKKESTELYVSSSSLNAVTSPAETLQSWKAGAQNYGRNAVQAFVNMELLKAEAQSAVENNKLVAALAWAPELLVDAMDAMNLPSLGLFPGPGNYGGLFTQLPVLVTGDLRPVRVSGSFKTENGQLVLVKGKPVIENSIVEKFEGFNTDDNIFTNGIMNSLTGALANGLMQAGNGSGNVDFVLAYNPTHGLVGDLVESAFDKNLSGSVLSGTARNLNDLFQGAVDAGPESLRIYGHSQGGLLTWVAVKGIDFSNVQMTSIQLSGAPIDAIQFHRDADAAGFKNDDQRVFQVNRPDESVFFGLLPKTDSVADLPVLLGGNSQYSDDPVKRALGALFTVTSLLDADSPHSNYSCINCPAATPSNVNTKIRDIVIKPTLIDSQGNATRLP